MTDETRLNRRMDDLRLTAFDLRVTELEGRVTRVEHGLQANTEELETNTQLTREVHTGLFGTEDEPGVYPMLATARDGLNLLSKTGRGIGRVAEWSGRVGKPLLVLMIVVAGLITYLKTGHLPPWLMKMLEMM